ncbi:hypothetical protein [Allocoleopsis sp.]|uniref:hypothetical protein n=1 Tax=Allocoleopsis sp. TaxID=3088169 RepID=UPI002FD03614
MTSRVKVAGQTDSIAKNPAVSNWGLPMWLKTRSLALPSRTRMVGRYTTLLQRAPFRPA